MWHKLNWTSEGSLPEWLTRVAGDLILVISWSSGKTEGPGIKFLSVWVTFCGLSRGFFLSSSCQGFWVYGASVPREQGRRARHFYNRLVSHLVLLLLSSIEQGSHNSCLGPRGGYRDRSNFSAHLTLDFDIPLALAKGIWTDMMWLDALNVFVRLGLLCVCCEPALSKYCTFIPGSGQAQHPTDNRFKENRENIMD